MSLATDIARIALDRPKLQNIINGDASTVITTDGGQVPSMARLLSQMGAGQIKGAWVTATSYVLGDVVTNGGTAYRCILAHTSAAALATDLTAGRWIVHYTATSTVDTIAALKAAANTHGVMQVLGYYAAGDGGGGLFRWDSASSATDNGGTVIIPTAAPATGRWKRVYSPGWVNVHWFGAKGDGVTNDRPAFLAVFTELTASTGGVAAVPTGNFLMGAAVAVPANVYLSGEGEIVSVMTASGAFTLLTFVGRNALIGIRLVGNAKTGVGLDIGGTDFAGQIVVDRCRINGFATGMKMSGSLWTTIRDTVVDSNVVGVDFNAATALHYCTTTDFFNCRISLNDRQGVKTGYVPVRNKSIQFIGGSIENNGSENPAIYGQCELTTMEQVGLIGLYVEYSVAGAKPSGVVLNDMSHVTIDRLFCNGSSTGVYSGANSLYNCKISRSRFVGTTTNDINITGAANAQGIILEHNEYSATNLLTVAANNLTNITKAYPEWTNAQTTFTPTLFGAGTAGAPTYTVQAGAYTRIGNMVCIQGRISISAKGGMAGAIAIGGLPVPAANTTHANGAIALLVDGVTFSGGNTGFLGLVPFNASKCDLYQQGAAASSQIVDTQLAAATTIIFSGWYAV